MAGKGSGGGTSFEGMSHEEMLAWLDQANAGEVQAAADRLIAAAKEIRKIAEELKVRPQWVEWKGEGADAFRTWAGDLANSTHRLGDFSEGAAKWLGEASGAIATAQTSIPRDTKSARANLDAATAAHNDPDAAAVRSKSASELAALKADREKVRQEAAAQMRKLAQSYSLSATQMNTLERPKFPPPPAAIQPIREGSDDVARPVGTPTEQAGGGSHSGTVGHAGTSSTQHRQATTPQLPSESPTITPSSEHLHRPTAEPATHVGIDSVTAPPEVHAGPTGGIPTTPRPDPAAPLPAGGPIPPNMGGPLRMPPGAGGPARPVGGGRSPVQTGRVSVGPTPGRGVTGVNPTPGRNVAPGAGTAGRPVPAQNPNPVRGRTAGPGITGGRVVAPSVPGRSTGPASGASSVGKPAVGRSSVARPPITGVTGQPITRSPGGGAGRVAPTPRDGISGGTPQRALRAPARPGTPVPSAPTRGGISGGVPSEARRQGGGRVASPDSAGARKKREKRPDDRRSERPTAD